MFHLFLDRYNGVHDGECSACAADAGPAMDEQTFPVRTLLAGVKSDVISGVLHERGQRGARTSSRQLPVLPSLEVIVRHIPCACLVASHADLEVAPHHERFSLLVRGALHLHLAVGAELAGLVREILRAVARDLVHQSHDHADALLVNHLPEIPQTRLDWTLRGNNQVVLGALVENSLDAVRIDVAILWRIGIRTEEDACFTERMDVTVDVHGLKVGDHLLFGQPVQTVKLRHDRLARHVDASLERLGSLEVLDSRSVVRLVHVAQFPCNMNFIRRASIRLLTRCLGLNHLFCWNSDLLFLLQL